MQVSNSSLPINTLALDRKTIATDSSTVPFNQIFKQAASRQSVLISDSIPTVTTSRKKTQGGVSDEAQVINSQPLFSTAKHGPPGSPPGFQEALYSLLNQPGFTREERMQISIQSDAALAFARHGPPEMAAKFPGYADAYTANFNPVRALLSTVSNLAVRYPNIAKIGNEWATAQGYAAAKTAV